MFTLFLFNNHIQAQYFKYMVVDFEGYPTGDIYNGIEGGFSYNDAVGEIANNPNTSSDWIGTQCLKATLTHNDGYGGIGRYVGHTIEMDVNADYFNFYAYNPTSGAVTITIAIQDDDGTDPTVAVNWNADDDDNFTKTITIAENTDWELISIPLSDFVDDVAWNGTTNVNGGNGILDIGYTGSNPSGLACVVFTFADDATFNGKEIFLDNWCFTEGLLMHGTSVVDYPDNDDTNPIKMGGFSDAGGTGHPENMPSEFNGLFSPQASEQKFCNMNWFISWAGSGDGTNANKLPGSEVQTLIDDGYTPMITWEPMFLDYDRLAAEQPSLADINNGNYDSYITNFANQIATYSGNVQIRFMHEMDGNFYPWCVPVNGFDADLYKNTYRHVVDIFNAQGATNVEWVWCVNGLSMPQQPNNWFVNYYPGDNYVDIVGVDVYNHPIVTPTPTWRSLIYEGGHQMYYMQKYFSHKQMYIPEVGCRERYSNENNSQSKAYWIENVAKLFKSVYDDYDAIMWFNVDKEHDWRINSSPEALTAFENSFYNDPYFSCGASSPTLSWGNGTFTESQNNDGSIGDSLILTLSGETFSTIGNLTSGSNYTTSNVPSGLTVNIYTNDANHATIYFSSTATSHESTNSISNLEISFSNSAFSGNDASTILNSTKSDLVVNFFDTPLDQMFADYDNIDLDFTGFGGNDFAEIYNPYQTGINTSDSVGYTNSGSEVWAGIAGNLSNTIVFGPNTVIRMKVYAPKICKITMKLEDQTDANINHAVQLTNTQINNWEEMEFDFSGAQSNTYDKIVLFFDIDSTHVNPYYFDDIELIANTLQDNVKNIIKDNSVTVYPNPFNNNITINTIDAQSINIYNSIGKLVFSSKINSRNQEIDLSELNNGLYILRVYSKSGIKQTKIIKK